MESNDYTIAKKVREILLSRAGEVTVYTKWSNAFAVEEMRKLPEQIKQESWFEKINPTRLTNEEMIKLGFGKWDESPGMLIPIWMFPYLADSFKAYSINGMLVEKTADMNIDNRFGYLAYKVISTKKEENNV